MLSLILAEAAIEMIPRRLWKHPSVKKQARKRKKKPRELILDRSYHHFAMKELRNNWKRGRPDIVHFSLLEALGTPLNKRGLLRTYVHTRDNFIIGVNPAVRLPRNYFQFIGLIEKLYKVGRVPEQDPVLLEMEKKSLHNLLEVLDADYSVILTSRGKPKTFQEVALTLTACCDPVVIVGAFPHGRFSEESLEGIKEVVSIGPEILESWTVVSRMLYAYEIELGLT